MKTTQYTTKFKEETIKEVVDKGHAVFDQRLGRALIFSDL
jgi:hypothetical protein